tara:strand:- start:352 stop:735 length:384 start_codon:yes stop_codon:yes gene_type:complete
LEIKISTGELMDKLSILEIKMQKIEDPKKSANVEKELKELNKHFQDLLDQYGEPIKNHYLELSKINKILWDVEDNIRKKEAAGEFDSKFVELARSVYITNDQRAKVKKSINLFTNSELIEEKSYSQY